MMDPSGMMHHYDSRPLACPPVPRPPMSPHYVVTSSYAQTPMTSAAPIAPLTSPHFPSHHGYNYGAYDASPAHSPPPFKPSYQERPNLRIQAPDSDLGRALSYPRDSRNAFEAHSPAPSIKSESQMSTRSLASNPSATAKSISCNLSINPQHKVDFSTDVDTLMKAIQAKRETDDMVKKAEQEAQVAQSPVGTPEVQTPVTPEAPAVLGKSSRKRFTCDVAGCDKGFFQKTHLDIHRRAHTGDKPYTCKQPGCGQRFSQLGNLKTHERRHTGERPFQCEQCGKRFAQRGNVRAHKIVHMQAKPYVCKLDDCNKQFTQLGNLKSHQNKFHTNALKDLTAKFATVTDTSKVSEADLELWEYFATLYKNSNKGIKGRGKDRKVGPSAQPRSASVPSQLPSPKHMPMPIRPPVATLHSIGHPGSLAAYSVSRPNVMMPVGPMASHPREVTGPYDLYGIEEHHHHGAPGPANVPGTMYEEDHSRSLAYAGRMYG